MASIQKRGKTYQYTISRTVNGKSKPIRKGGFRTKKEARIAANELEAQLNKGILPHLKPIAFNEYFDKWFHLYKKHVTQTTFKHYEYTLNAIENHFYDKAIQDITKHDYQEFINTFGSNKLLKLSV
ncbi:hypothetical protein GCM10008934_16470 [Virgibacillus salarius]|uniref:Arm DNA-binding domain-containing protein n=1 Tax=Virgibacillus salarius TaxID=447199 RepID=UPI0031D592BB